MRISVWDSRVTIWKYKSAQVLSSTRTSTMPARLLYCYACEKDVPVKSERGLQQHRKICQKKSEKRKTDKSRLKRKLKKVYVRRSLSPQDVSIVINF